MFEEGNQNQSEVSTEPKGGDLEKILREEGKLVRKTIERSVVFLLVGVALIVYGPALLALGSAPIVFSILLVFGVVGFFVWALH